MTAPFSRTLSAVAKPGTAITDQQVADIVEQTCPAKDYRAKKVLLIVPDQTRTAPIGTVFKAIFAQIGEATQALDVMIALGTHPPMSEDAICARLEISREERDDMYRTVRFINHEWDNPDALKNIGTIPAADISALTGGL